MNFALKKPCSNCPFRKDVANQQGWLGEMRARDIMEGLIDADEDGNASETRKSQHCAGAMILLHKIGMPNQAMRIAGRLGMYRYEDLDHEAPIFDSPEEFISWHA